MLTRHGCPVAVKLSLTRTMNCYSRRKSHRAVANMPVMPVIQSIMDRERHSKPVERRLMQDIPEEALRTIEESFGARFVRHAANEAKPDTEEPFASVFPESAEEVESLTRLAARHRIPLMARGAGTALNPTKVPRALAVRFDAMRTIRLPEGEAENWVEVEPGVTWRALEERLRESGMGPRVYPTSAPRSTVGGWLAENGLGVGSYEYGWLLQNVLSVEAVLAGG